MASLGKQESSHMTAEERANVLGNLITQYHNDVIDLDQLADKLYEAGRSSMQEQAAKCAESVKLDYSMVANERRTQEKIAAAIRALKP